MENLKSPHTKLSGCTEAKTPLHLVAGCSATLVEDECERIAVRFDSHLTVHFGSHPFGKHHNRYIIYLLPLGSRALRH